MIKKEKGSKHALVLSILKILTPNSANKLSVAVKRDPIDLTSIIEDYLFDGKLEIGSNTQGPQGPKMELSNEELDTIETEEPISAAAPYEKHEGEEALPEALVVMTEEVPAASTKIKSSTAGDNLKRSKLISTYQKSASFKKSGEKSIGQRIGILVNYKSDT